MNIRSLLAFCFDSIQDDIHISFIKKNADSQMSADDIQYFRNYFTQGYGYVHLFNHLPLYNISMYNIVYRVVIFMKTGIIIDSIQ